MEIIELPKIKIKEMCFIIIKNWTHAITQKHIGEKEEICN